MNQSQMNQSQMNQSQINESQMNENNSNLNTLNGASSVEKLTNSQLGGEIKVVKKN